MELREDGIYSQDFGRFTYGHWSLKDKRLYLTDQQNTTYIYAVKSLDAKELQLALGKGKIGHFEGLALPSFSLAEDPFSPGNNQWRIPATVKEDMTAIHKRLYDHCHFLELYFAWAANKKVETIDVSGMPTPMKLYTNGFGLKHYADLPREWKSYFFDEEDCHKADSVIKHTFRRHDIKWPETQDNYKKLVAGFQQLQQFLK